MILCCGEALIDFLPMADAGEPPAFRAFNGGSIYNVAIALGRLGRPVGFLGGLSRDLFGERLRAGLAASGVDLAHVVASDRSSTLAFVEFRQGEPHYAFVDGASAGRMLQPEDLPAPHDEVKALHFGSISLIHDPAGASLAGYAARHKERCVISLDPNIRAGQVQDRAAYLARLEAMIGLADIVKLSDVDLEWMMPGADIEDVAARWVAAGTRLVAVTRGGKGAVAFAVDGRHVVSPQTVEVADTIGAGDTFMAGLLASLDGQGLLERESVKRLDAAAIGKALDFAARAAAITVSRPGANPPWSNEINRDE